MKRTVFAARWCLLLEAIVLTLGCSATQPPPNNSVPAMSSVAAIATELGRRMTQDFPGPLSLDRRLGVSAVSRCVIEPGLGVCEWKPTTCSFRLPPRPVRGWYRGTR